MLKTILIYEILTLYNQLLNAQEEFQVKRKLCWTFEDIHDVQEDDSLREKKYDTMKIFWFDEWNYLTLMIISINRLYLRISGGFLKQLWQKKTCQNPIC